MQMEVTGKVSETRLFDILDSTDREWYLFQPQVATHTCPEVTRTTVDRNGPAGIPTRRTTSHRRLHSLFFSTPRHLQRTLPLHLLA